MSDSVKCMTYAQRQEWLRANSWRIAGDVMKLHPIDRMGVLSDLPKALETAVKKREQGE